MVVELITYYYELGRPMTRNDIRDDVKLIVHQMPRETQEMIWSKDNGPIRVLCELFLSRHKQILNEPSISKEGQFDIQNVMRRH